MTRFGMKEEAFGELAEYMAAVILGGKGVSQKVSSLRERFTKMHYCLPEEQVKPLVNELLGSVMNS